MESEWMKRCMTKWRMLSPSAQVIIDPIEITTLAPSQTPVIVSGQWPDRESNSPYSLRAAVATAQRRKPT